MGPKKEVKKQYGLRPNWNAFTNFITYIVGFFFLFELMFSEMIVS